MPYVKQDIREQLLTRQPEDVGELTYVISETVRQYIVKKQLDEGVPLSYSLFSEGIAALENSKLELYRTGLAPYEDVKIQENGALGQLQPDTGTAPTKTQPDEMDTELDQELDL